MICSVVAHRRQVQVSGLCHRACMMPPSTGTNILVEKQWYWWWNCVKRKLCIILVFVPRGLHNLLLLFFSKWAKFVKGRLQKPPKTWFFSDILMSDVQMSVFCLQNSVHDKVHKMTVSIHPWNLLFQPKIILSSAPHGLNFLLRHTAIQTLC